MMLGAQNTRHASRDSSTPEMLLLIPNLLNPKPWELEPSLCGGSKAHAVRYKAPHPGPSIVVRSPAGNHFQIRFRASALGSSVNSSSISAVHTNNPE